MATKKKAAKPAPAPKVGFNGAEVLTDPHFILHLLIDGRAVEVELDGHEVDDLREAVEDYEDKAF